MENNISERLDKALLEKQAERDKRERSGKWQPSKLGRCFRFQYWNREDKPVSNPIDVSVLRIFACGEIFHDFLKGFYTNDEALREVLAEIEDVRGYADMVTENSIIEIKSVRSFAFTKLLDKRLDINEIKLCEILQTVYYASILNKPEAIVVFVNKDDLSIVEHRVLVTDWIDTLAYEMAQLRKYWDKKELPPAEPRAYISYKFDKKTGKVLERTIRECQYCAYRDECKALEKGVAY